MGHTVLIIDDDAGTRGLLTQVLQAEGYDTVTAQNGAEAVRRLVEVKPCVIVLDFEMPVMDAPDVPIICLTGAADAEHTARVVGASSVQPKPPDLEELCRTVAGFCRLPHEHRHTAAVESSIEPDRRGTP